MLRPGVLVTLLVIAAGCSGTGTTAPDASANTAAVGSEAKSAESADATNYEIVAEDVKKQDVVCRREKPIGSNIGRRVCRPRGAVSPTREGDQEALISVQGLSDDDRKVFGEDRKVFGD